MYSLVSLSSFRLIRLSGCGESKYRTIVHCSVTVNRDHSFVTVTKRLDTKEAGRCQCLTTPSLGPSGPAQPAATVPATNTTSLRNLLLAKSDETPLYLVR